MSVVRERARQNLNKNLGFLNLVFGREPRGGLRLFYERSF